MRPARRAGYHRRMVRPVSALAAAAVLTACSNEPDTTGTGTTSTFEDTGPDIQCDAPKGGAAVPFEDATEAWGLDFRHHAATAFCDITDTVGGPGVCAFDYDGDSDVDLYFVDRAGSSNRLYRN